MTEDINEARRWVEQAIGVGGTEKEHVDMGGQYFKFEIEGGSLSLLNNFDIFDHQPISPPEFAQWKLVIVAFAATQAIEKLRLRPDRFWAMATG